MTLNSGKNRVTGETALFKYIVAKHQRFPLFVLLHRIGLRKKVSCQIGESSKILTVCVRWVYVAKLLQNLIFLHWATVNSMEFSLELATLWVQQERLQNNDDCLIFLLDCCLNVYHPQNLWIQKALRYGKIKFYERDFFVTNCSFESSKN